MTLDASRAIAVAGLLALSACQPGPLRTEAQPGPFPGDLPPQLTALTVILPEGEAVCRRLGLDPAIPGRCSSAAVLVAAARQTDRSLWFYKTSTRPVPGTCPHAVPFDTVRGTKIPNMLCGQPDMDARITPDDLAGFAAVANRLNAIPRKTLAEHNKAREMKADIACFTGTNSDDCS